MAGPGHPPGSGLTLKLSIDPDIALLTQDEIAAGERAVSAAVGPRSRAGLNAAWRVEIAGARLGAHLARTIRSEQFPKATPSLNAAAVVWSNAPVIVGAHDTGPPIRSKSGFWLAIPTPTAGESLRGGRITPGEWERRNGLHLRFSYRRGVQVCWCRGAAEHEGPRRSITVEDRPGPCDRADLPTGSAGQAAEAAGLGARCGTGSGRCAGLGRGELGRRTRSTDVEIRNL